MIGTRLGPYQITAKLGEGGMGVVYRARDTRLGREVALKFLPAEFAEDPERHARFEREAKLLASLNHSNIAVLYGLEHLDGQHALVMELVEGEGLDERIARGPVPFDEAIPIAGQIAEGLEAAHEKGIVHRDLKPANVKVRPDGTVKVLDFGLAKAWEEEVEESDPAYSPTITGHHTRAGVILGTAAYMSPEQARGKPVDKRADIWAFGCVLWEMLTGRRLFQGETVSDVLAAILKTDPDWSFLPADLPLPIRRLLTRCLEREPRRRLRDIGEARIAIEGALSGAASDFVALPSEPTAAPHAPGWRRALPWSLAVLAIVAAAITVEYLRPARSPAQVMRFGLAPPEAGHFAEGVGADVALSPDGTHMVYVLRANGRDQLHLRRLDSEEDALLPGTEGAMTPFFSPDGTWVAFFAQGKLEKVAVTGGMPATLCDAPNARGGVWGPDDTILFTPTPDSPLARVSANGGAPVPVTKLTSEPEPASRSHRWPWLLPGGREALFNVVYHTGNPLDHSDIGVVSIATGTYRILIRGGSFPRYLPTGHIVYVVGTDMLAVPFDARSLKLAGPPLTVVKGVGTRLYSGAADFSFSETGTLVWLAENSPPAATDRLVWVDRKGAVQPVTSRLNAYAYPRVLPDGRRVVMEVDDRTPGLWLYDATRDTLSPLAVEGRDAGPVLTPDGEAVIYVSIRNGSEGLWMRRVDGSGHEENLTATTMSQIPNSISQDGESVAFGTRDATRNVLLRLNLTGNHKAEPLLPGPGNRAAAAFSPDGRWIAYVSDESGENEVYVAAASGNGSKWQISSGGGAEPVWARDGRELFFRTGNKMMAFGVSGEEAFSTGRAVELFEGDFEHGRGPIARLTPDYDVSPDGRRFLMIQPTGPRTATAPAQGMHVVLNWFDDLQRRFVQSSQQ